MKTRMDMWTVVAAITAACSWSSVAHAEEVGGGEPGHGVSVEANPMDFAMRGASVFVGFRPAGIRRLEVAVGGYFNSLPPFLVNMNAGNAGFLVDNKAALASVTWRFSDARGGFFAGASAGYVRTTYRLEGATGSAAMEFLIDLLRSQAGRLKGND